MTGLPEHLTDTVRLLRQKYPSNLVADATLYDLPEGYKAKILIAHLRGLPGETRVDAVVGLLECLRKEERAEIKRRTGDFSRPSRLAVRVEDEDGTVIGEIPEITGGVFTYVHEDGTAQRLRYITHRSEFGPGAKHRSAVIVEVLTD